ncbi:hypothetical protein REPUB_Repub03eG0007900 [Reevesia pubescens]
MATYIFSNLFPFLLPPFLFFALLLHSSKTSYAFQEKMNTLGIDDLRLRYSHIVPISSLLPSTVCNSSTKEINKKSSLEVVHKHGPCFQSNQDRANAPSHAEILSQDQSRVDSIHSMLSLNSMEEIDAVRLPTKKGLSVGTGNYLVTVSFGSPPKKYALIFDTGSHFTWTQCKPCAGFCHDQVEPIFNPSKSKSYANISCRAATCNQISAEGMEQGCSSSTCLYGISYGDSSSSLGFLAKEKLTISRSDVFPGYLFGCGQQNQFRNNNNRVAGLIGLGRGKFSFVSQTAKKYSKIFSHCLPSDDSSVGYLSFGRTKLPKKIKFTTMPKSFQNTSFYGLDIIGINVAGQRVPIKSSVFKTAGAIIDSGTVITRLPPTAYAQFKSAFQKRMTKYPKLPPHSILDTCYDFSGSDVIKTPAVSMVFGGGVEVGIDFSGVLYMINASQGCLAFAKNTDATDVAIFGNVQQKTYEVVYDDVKGRVGFAPAGCR